MCLIFEPATFNDLDHVAALEAASYHPDEAASREQLKNRIQYAQDTIPDLFLVARSSSDNNSIAGFACSTVSKASLVTEESMKTHDPDGTTVCLHSVCVAPHRRRQGVAKELLRQWIQRLRQTARFQRIALLSRPHLIPLYESVGFKTLGKSSVVHGPDPWYDAVLDL